MHGVEFFTRLIQTLRKPKEEVNPQRFLLFIRLQFREIKRNFVLLVQPSSKEVKKDPFFSVIFSFLF